MEPFVGGGHWVIFLSYYHILWGASHLLARLDAKCRAWLQYRLMKTIKLLVDYSDGKYFATSLESLEITESSSPYIYSIPEDKFREWEECNKKATEWQYYWRRLVNRVDSAKCEHEYLPDEDGTVYHCGSDDNVTYVDGFFLYQQHL